jgi:hypothetical protein
MKILWAIIAVVAIYGGAVNIPWIAGMLYEGARGAALGLDGFVEINKHSHPAVKTPERR